MYIISHYKCNASGINIYIFLLQEIFSLLKAQHAAVILHLGIIGLETEEFSTGQEHLEKVLQIISGFEISPLCISIAVLCYNNLAVLWCQRDEQGNLISVYNNLLSFLTIPHKRNKITGPSPFQQGFGVQLRSPIIISS